MSKHESITQLLERWDELREQGHEAKPEELCGDSLEILPELRVQIDRLKAMDWLDAAEDELDRSGGAGFQPGVLSGQEAGRLEASPTSSVPANLGGRYEMKSLIAEGGFGQVWRALDTSLQRMVAIKITTVDCRSEARRVAQLKHHGIVTVHDVGNDNGLCYIVFDLIEGSTLAEKIQQGTLTAQQAVRIVAEVAEYVQFAHDKGFIHRDIKPANILLDEHDTPVLADFGIAVTECELRHEAVTSVGTLAYMAPEQLQHDDLIDARTDVYGLGVVLYELLTGRPPYSNPTLSGLRAQILAGNPPMPRLLNPAIPPEYERICLKCLSLNRDDRYLTAQSLADALKQTIPFGAKAP